MFTLINNRPEDLVSKKRYIEAGRVLFDYAEDEREAVIALVQGNQFSEARRIVSCHLGPSSIPNPTTCATFQITMRDCPELLEEIVSPTVLEVRTEIAEDLTEMREQLQKQIARLRELRIKKEEEPGTPANTTLRAFPDVALRTSFPNQRNSMAQKTSRCTT
jgi:elongator complex protein 1